MRDRLIRAGSDRLADELLHLAERDPALKRRIELLANENDPGALARALSRQIAGLRRRETFVSYRESFPFAGELREVVEAIRQKVLPALPARAFELADAFLSTDNDTFERVDDSAGVVGDAYREACLLWIDAAARCKGDEDWVERIRKTAAQNDYGVRDPLLPNADRLLTEHELRRLVLQYEESGARLSKKSTADVPFEAIRCWSDMAQVARALRDPVLFERARTNSRDRVDDRLRLEVATLCIEWGQIDKALVRLEAASGSDGYVRNELLLRCYEALGDVPRQVELLWRLFEELLHHETFSRLLELTPRSQRKAARARAKEAALRHGDPLTVVEFLLRSGWETDAERVAIERREGFDGVYYETLLDLASLAAAAGQPRIEVLCYRNLLRDILDRGRSKAYGHAARYYRRLAQLDKEVSGYGPLGGHSAFVEEIGAAHGRKRAFWTRVEKGKSATE